VASATLTQSLRYRLYPSVDQEEVLRRYCAHSRALWNCSLEQFGYWRHGRPPSPNHAVRSRQLTEARSELPWLREVPRSVQQVALLDFDRACQEWWRGKGGYPHWRSKRRAGFGMQGCSIRRKSRKWAILRVPLLGEVRLRCGGLQIPPVDVVRVTCDGKNRWHVSVVVRVVPEAAPDSSGRAIGIDRGVVNALALSDGRMFKTPSSKRGDKRVAALQRRLARQRRGSVRREKTKRVIAGIRQTEKDRRRDWIEQRTAELLADFGVFAVEDLRVANMVRRPAPKVDETGKFLPNGATAKASLNRDILGQGWSHFLTRLQEKAAHGGAIVVLVAPHNTSRECRACGHIASGNRKSQAVFACEQCGHRAHADTNAAENILARGLSALAHTPGSGARGHCASARVTRPQGAARTTAIAERSLRHG